MHILASRNRSEFLVCPQTVRFDFARGHDNFEPTLLIKGSTLLLKYLVMGVRTQLAFARMGNRLLYGLKVYEDPEKPALLWSVLERAEEMSALAALERGEICQTFLFNEVAVNVTSCTHTVDLAGADLKALLHGVATGLVDHSAIKSDVSPILNRLGHESMSAAGIVIADVCRTTDWKKLINVLITNRASSSLIDLFDTDEGNQQEQVGLWLTDN